MRIGQILQNATQVGHIRLTPQSPTFRAITDLDKIIYIPALLTSKSVGKHGLQCKIFNKVKIFKNAKIQNKVKFRKGRK